MFKLIREKVWGFIKDKVDDVFLINTNPYIMKKLCEEDPNFIKYAKGKGVTPELIDILYSHEDVDYEQILYDALYCNRGGIRSNVECMKKLCAIDGKYFEWCDSDAISFENFMIAFNHSDSSKRISLNDAIWTLGSCISKRNVSALKEFCRFNGRFIEEVSAIFLTKEVLEIAFSHVDDDKKPNLSAVSFRDDFRVMSILCEINGNNFIYADCEEKQIDLLRKALSHSDFSKRLSYDKIPRNFSGTFDEEIINELIKYDCRWINYSSSIYNEDFKEILLKVLEDNPGFTITSFLFDKYKNDKEIMPFLMKNLKDGKYSSDYLIDLLKVSIDRKFINSDFFCSSMRMVCKDINVDYDFLKYHLERAININNNILTTLDLRFLQTKYQKLYDEDSYDKFYMLATYPDIQEMIIEISEPRKEDNSIDYELGEKKLLLLSKMFKLSNIDKSGCRIENWVPFYNRILTDFSWNPEMYDYLAEHQDELTPDMLEKLTNHALANHRFKIESLEQLINYEETRKKWIEEALKSDDIYVIKDAVFEKVFGISCISATSLLQPYLDGVLSSPEFFSSDIVNFFQSLKLILEEDNIDILKECVFSFKRNEKLDERELILFSSDLKRVLVDEYNKSLFLVKDKKHDCILDGVKVYKAAGEDGDKEFNLLIHSLRAYSGGSDSLPDNFNYKDDWNRAEMGSHGLCTSYIGNSNLGTAVVPMAIVGLTEYDSSSLLLCANYDIGSSAANRSFNTSDFDGRSRYLLPDKMKDYTRHTHNEMVFERGYGKHKKYPSYIVLDCDTYDKAIAEYEKYAKMGRYIDYEACSDKDNKEARVADYVYQTIKAAKEFGLPIVVVEREKIAINQHQQIMEKLEEFREDNELNREEIRDYFHDIITVFASNYIGNTYHQEMQKKYFSKSDAEKIIEVIQEKNDKCSSDDMLFAFMLVDELEKVMKIEDKYFNDEKATMVKDDKSIFKISSILKYCETKKGEILKNISNDNDINCVFTGKITNDSHLIEFKRIVDDLDEEQFLMGEVQEILTGDLKSKIMVTIDDIKDESYYDSDTKRHVENVVLFSGIIGSQVNLLDEDLDILLTAALYCECDDVTIIEDKLGGRFPEQDLKIIKAVVSYLKSDVKINEDSSVDYTDLDNICSNLKLDVDDEILMEKVRNIADCLKDVHELDKTRFLANSDSFVKPDLFCYEVSEKLIRISMQINEYYAGSDVLKVVAENPGLYEVFSEGLSKDNNPKEILFTYRNGNLKSNVSEEMYTNGKKQ